MEKLKSIFKKFNEKFLSSSLLGLQASESSVVFHFIKPNICLISKRDDLQAEGMAIKAIQ